MNSKLNSDNSSKFIYKIKIVLFILTVNLLQETVTKKKIKRNLKRGQAGLGDFFAAFVYLGRVSAHEFNQIGLWFALLCTCARGKSLLMYEWASILSLFFFPCGISFFSFQLYSFMGTLWDLISHLFKHHFENINISSHSIHGV